MTRPIVVAGESLVDLMVDETGRVVSSLGGGPYNTARTVGRLGGHVAFLGAISRDRFGELLLRGLADDGVVTDLVVRTDAPTTLALAELEHGIARYRFHVQGTAAPELSGSAVSRAIDAAPWALHVGTLGLVFEPIGTNLEALVAAMPADTWLMLDPNARPSATPVLDAWRARIDRFVARAAVIRVTTDDLEVLRPGIPPLEVASDMLSRGPRVVLLTDGPRAVHILRRGYPLTTLPVPPVEVVDTVGSGDAFGGAFLAWWQMHHLGIAELDDGVLIRRATEAAIRVASITCTRTGAEPPTLDQMGGWDAPGVDMLRG